MTAAHDVHLSWCKWDVKIINSHGCISGAALVVLKLVQPAASCSPKICDLGRRGSSTPLQNFLAKYPTHQYHHLHLHRWHKHQGTSGIIGPEREREREQNLIFATLAHTPSSPLPLSSSVRHHCQPPSNPNKNSLNRLSSLLDNAITPQFTYTNANTLSHFFCSPSLDLKNSPSLALFL